MPKFAKGHAKLGGRARGTPNRASVQVRDLARSLVSDPKYLEQFKRRLFSGKLHPTLENPKILETYGIPSDRSEDLR